MVSVSACVITHDDESQIRRCLESLSWADETVVVVDERSRDATEAVARQLGARVLRHRYEGNVEQKDFALDQARGEWVVSLDADEALSEELSVRLRDLPLRPPARLLRAYVWKGGFRDGVPGLTIAAVSSFHVFLEFAKLWELEHVARGRGA
jgi:glycosyltransferase involved in cell wall biosynthesis